MQFYNIDDIIADLVISENLLNVGEHLNYLFKRGAENDSSEQISSLFLKYATLYLERDLVCMILCKNIPNNCCSARTCNNEIY